MLNQPVRIEQRSRANGDGKVLSTFAAVLHPPPHRRVSVQRNREVFLKLVVGVGAVHKGIDAFLQVLDLLAIGHHGRLRQVPAITRLQGFRFVTSRYQFSQDGIHRRGVDPVLVFRMRQHFMQSLYACVTADVAGSAQQSFKNVFFP